LLERSPTLLPATQDRWQNLPASMGRLVVGLLAFQQMT
jgi:hypothetical protein